MEHFTNVHVILHKGQVDLCIVSSMRDVAKVDFSVRNLTTTSSSSGKFIMYQFHAIYKRKNSK